MRRGVNRSVRHQDRQSGVCKNMSRRAAEDHLPQAALRVGAFDQQVAAERGRVLKNDFAGRATRRGLTVNASP